MDDQVLITQKTSNDFWLPWTQVEFSELDDFFEQVKPWKNEMIASTDFILGQYEGGWAKDEKALRETLKRDAEFALYVVKKYDNKDKDAEVKGSDKKKYKRYNKSDKERNRKHSAGGKRHRQKNLELTEILYEKIYYPASNYRSNRRYGFQ